MKACIFTVVVSIVLTSFAVSQTLFQSKIDSVNQTNSTVNTYFPVIIDPGMTMRIGAENTVSILNGLAAAEDHFIKTKWFAEHSVAGKTGGIAGRLAKYALIDLPADYFSVVLAHEFFGHGARYRELDMNNIFYAFDMPPPYGNGGGEASNYESVEISQQELLSIWQGGVEVHPLIWKNLQMRWMANNEINYREASQYYWAQQIMMDYIQKTDEDLTNGTTDNDLRAYVRIINANAGHTDLQHLPLTVNDLKSRMLLNVINPFFYYSVFTILKTYFWDGNRSNSMPVISIGKVGYLPAFRSGLTPFGIEYHFENYLRFNRKVALLDLSYGDQSLDNTWGGVGVSVQNMIESPQWSINFYGNIWQQPDLAFGNNPAVEKGGGLGGAFSVRGYYHLKNTAVPLSAVIEMGYKSTGFLEGYAIDASPILAIGLAMRH